MEHTYQGVGEDVLRVLIGGDSIVEVRACGDGCVVTYPAIPLRFPEDATPFRQAYAVDRDAGVARVSFNSTRDVTEQSVEVPEHVIRQFVEGGIQAVLHEIEVTVPVVFFNEEGQRVDGFRDVLKPPFDSEEARKEELLDSLVSEARLRGVTRQLEATACRCGLGNSFQALVR